MNKKTKRQKMLAFAGFLATAAAASAQTTGLGAAAQDAVDDSITAVTPILAVILGFTILVGMIFAFCKKR